jgi:hypothetical protein
MYKKEAKDLISKGLVDPMAIIQSQKKSNGVEFSKLLFPKLTIGSS